MIRPLENLCTWSPDDTCFERFVDWDSMNPQCAQYNSGTGSVWTCGHPLVKLGVQDGITCDQNIALSGCGNTKVAQCCQNQCASTIALAAVVESVPVAAIDESEAPAKSCKHSNAGREHTTGQSSDHVVGVTVWFSTSMRHKMLSPKIIRQRRTEGSCPTSKPCRIRHCYLAPPPINLLHTLALSWTSAF